MKHKVELIIFLLLGLTSLVYVFPFAFVDAAKLQSGVTITAPATTETEKICDDTIDNDNDGKIDANDSDCAAAPAGPAAGTCGLQIVSGVPINYGQLTAGQASAKKQVMVKNEGTAGTTAKLMIKGGNWIGDAAGDPTIFGPEVTKIGLGPTWDYNLSMIGLTSNGFEIGQMPGGQSWSIYFVFGVPANAPSGSFHQEVTMDLLC